MAEIAASGGKAKAYKADVADLAAVQAMVDAIVKDFGGLNILVNNAGLAMRQRFVETTPDGLEAARSTSASTARSIAATPPRRTSRAARTAASSASIGDSSRVGESGLAIVAAARAGVVALMKSLAREFGRSGTTANTVSLGLVETAHDRDWVEANRDKLTRLYPLRRLGQPDDVAPDGGVARLAASGWITGQVHQHQRRLQHGVMRVAPTRNDGQRPGDTPCCTPT